MKRVRSIIEVNSEKSKEYKKLHAAIWPQVLETISLRNICNYPIYCRSSILNRQIKAVN